MENSQEHTVKIQGHSVDFEKLKSNADGYEWAEQFNQALVNQGLQPLDHHWLVSWFSTAVMCGYDRALKQVRQKEELKMKAVRISLKKEFS